MKNTFFALLILFTAFSCKKEESESGDPARMVYSFEIVDRDDKSIFLNNGYNSDSVLFRLKNLDGTFNNYKAGFRIFLGKMISKSESPFGAYDNTSGNYISTTYVYLNRNDTDTLRVVMFPSSVRNIGSGKYNFPTRIQFFYNGKLNQDYDFVKTPELLQPFWETDGVGQIITLKK